MVSFFSGKHTLYKLIFIKPTKTVKNTIFGDRCFYNFDENHSWSYPILETINEYASVRTQNKLPNLCKSQGFGKTTLPSQESVVINFRP